MKKLIYTLVILSLAVSLNAQWESDVRLTNSVGNSYTSLNNAARCIAANGNIVHTVFYDFRDGNSEIYYKRSTDGGTTWEADTRLTNNTAESRYPSIAVSGSIVHVVWEDDRDGGTTHEEIYYKRSTDGGITWGADIRLTNNTNYSWWPSISVSGSLVNVVWLDGRDGNDEIYYKRSTDDGTTWGADIRLTNNISECYQPSISVSGSLVHVVWSDNRDSNYEIYFKRSTDGGTTWGTDTRLTNNSGNSGPASIAVTGSFVHLVWADNRDINIEIYYKRSTDGGITWGTDIRLTNNAGSSLYPSIAINSSLLHVVWYDNRDGNDEIYYKRSTDIGTTWGTDTRLTEALTESQSPYIVVSGTLVHIVWWDYRNGDSEIYYKRNPNGNVGIQNIGTEIPSMYSLGQNFPNPFNPSTKIKFVVASVGYVKIIVYDAMGREVQTLVNEQLQPGTYETDWNATSFSSGVYFYKIVAGNYTETRKMILMK